jgi:hypothetical protein
MDVVSKILQASGGERFGEAKSVAFKALMGLLGQDNVLHHVCGLVVRSITKTGTPG